MQSVPQAQHIRSGRKHRHSLYRYFKRIGISSAKTQEPAICGDSTNRFLRDLSGHAEDRTNGVLPILRPLSTLS